MLFDGNGPSGGDGGFGLPCAGGGGRGYGGGGGGGGVDQSVRAGITIGEGMARLVLCISSGAELRSQK